MNRDGFSQLVLLIVVGAVLVLAGASTWFYKQSAEQHTSAAQTQAAPKSSPGETSSATETTETQTAPKLSGETSSIPMTSVSSSGKTLLAPVQQTKPTDHSAVQKTSTPTVVSTTQSSAQTDGAPLSPAPTPTPDISCASQYADTENMDIFDSHAHITPKVSMPQIISEMNKANVSVTNLYSGTPDTTAQYPGRFITFVDTPDSPQPSTWLTQGQSFLTSAETQLKTGKFYGIGETNLRYYTGNGGAIVPPPAIAVAPDTPLWLQLVDLAAQYHVPISFHFIPDDSAMNAAFERMLGHNKDAILIWAHLGFNNMTLNSATLNDYLLRYPNLYFDTAGIQNMQNPLSQPNSNWARLADQSTNGRLNEEWKKFFETWNARILFGSDAGGGANSLERWLNYTDNTSDLATPNAVGHWTHLLSNLDSNAARNILSGNAKELFLKKQKPAYNYSVSSGGKCYSISINSESSISELTFNSTTRTITFTAAGSNGTTGRAAITIPTALAGGNFTASVDGQNVKSQLTTNSVGTTVSLEYVGGIRSITLSVPSTP